MSTIKLTGEMTKNEFRKEFTENFDYIYIRVKGKSKLEQAKETEISIDGNLTIAEFEKDATAKTGVEVSVYYETKPEGKRSKYYQANKEDAKTTLADLETRVAEMDNIVSEKEYFENLVGDKAQVSTDNNSNDVAKSIIKLSVGELYNDNEDEFLEFEENFNLFHNEYSNHIMSLLDDKYGILYKNMTLPDSTVVEFSEDIKLYSTGDAEYCWTSAEPIIFGITTEVDSVNFVELLMNDFQDWHDGESIITFYVTIINGDDENEYCYSWHYEDGYVLETV